MKTYKVEAREVWVQTYFVEADSEDEAARLVDQGHGESEDNSLEYSHNLDPSNSVVEED